MTRHDKLMGNKDLSIDSTQKVEAPARIGENIQQRSLDDAINRAITKMQENKKLKGFGKDSNFTLNNTTAHKDVEHLSSLDHPELNVNVNSLSAPNNPGITAVAGMHVSPTGQKHFIKDVTNPVYGEASGVHEVLVPAISKFFGIEHMVPKTTMHHIPDRGHVIAQEFMEDHQNGPNSRRLSLMGSKEALSQFNQGLQLSAKRGDLAKAAVMNFITGNIDRHRGNYLAHPDQGVKLIDHGLTFTSHGNEPIYPRYLKEDPVKDEPLPSDFIDYVKNLPVNQMEDKIRHVRGLGLIDPDYNIERKRRFLLSRLKKHGNVLSHGDLFDAMSAEEE